MMRPSIPHGSLSVFLCLFILSFSHPCLPAVETRPNISIIATVFPLMEFAGEVSGDRGEAALLLPPGAEIHTWRPRPSDIIMLSSADLFIYIGADLEPWIDDVLKSIDNPDLNVMEASRGISLLGENHSGGDHEHQHGQLDPHIWLDFKYDQIIVTRIADILAEIDPDGASEYRKNAESYIRKLEKLDEVYHQTLEKCPQKELFMGGHAAFGYLAERYGLHQISLYGLNPDSAPSPRRLVEVSDMARRKKVKVIYFETQVGDKLAKVLADEVGARTMVLNPGANLSPEEWSEGLTFIDIMMKNLKNLKNGLSGE